MRGQSKNQEINYVCLQNELFLLHFKIILLKLSIPESYHRNRTPPGYYSNTFPNVLLYFFRRRV